MSTSAVSPARGFASTVRVAAWGWTAIIFVLLWMPPPPPPEHLLWWWDLAVHFALMTVFAGLWTWHRLPGARLWAVGVAVGALTEIVQGLLPWERHSALDDFGADLLGMAVGWLLARLLWPRWLGTRPRFW